MNRRTALATLSTIVAACATALPGHADQGKTVIRSSNGKDVLPFTPKANGLFVLLDLDGIDELEVRYNGQKKMINKAELFKAL